MEQNQFKNQFNRSYKIVFKNLEKSQDNVFEIDNLRVQFDIELYVDQKEKTNVGTISIYNLQESSFKQMDCKNGYIWVYAGYNDKVALIAEGDVINVATTKSGTDVVTEFKLAEGFRDLTIRKLTPTTLPEGVLFKDVVLHISNDLGLATTSFVGDWQNIPFVYGYPLYGNARSVLDNICRANDLEWKIVNNALVVTDRHGLINRKGETAIVLSKQTGLIDIPFRDTDQISQEITQVLDEEDSRVIPKTITLKKDGTPRKTKTRTIRRYSVRMKALLNPLVKPNGLIKLETDAKLLDGFYRVRSVIFKGDSRGGEWFMEIYGDSVHGEELL